jgi:hypothetical protein
MRKIPLPPPPVHSVTHEYYLIVTVRILMRQKKKEIAE